MGWEPNQMVHTFKTGRTAVIRKRVSMAALMRETVRSGDEAAAAVFLEMQTTGEARSVAGAVGAMEATVTEMWIAPRVVWDDEDVPDYGDGPKLDENGWPPVVHARDLEDDEVSETMDIAFGGVAEAESFRDDGPGVGGGGDGAGVGSKPKRGPRPAGGKR